MTSSKYTDDSISSSKDEKCDTSGSNQILSNKLAGSAMPKVFRPAYRLLRRAPDHAAVSDVTFRSSEPQFKALKPQRVGLATFGSATRSSEGYWTPKISISHKTRLRFIIPPIGHARNQTISHAMEQMSPGQTVVLSQQQLENQMINAANQHREYLRNRMRSRNKRFESPVLNKCPPPPTPVLQVVEGPQLTLHGHQLESQTYVQTLDDMPHVPLQKNLQELCLAIEGNHFASFDLEPHRPHQEDHTDEDDIPPHYVGRNYVGPSEETFVARSLKYPTAFVAGHAILGDNAQSNRHKDLGQNHLTTDSEGNDKAIDSEASGIPSVFKQIHLLQRGYLSGIHIHPNISSTYNNILTPHGIVPHAARRQTQLAPLESPHAVTVPNQSVSETMRAHRNLLSQNQQCLLKRNFAIKQHVLFVEKFNLKKSQKKRSGKESDKVQEPKKELIKIPKLKFLKDV